MCDCVQQPLAGTNQMVNWVHGRFDWYVPAIGRFMNIQHVGCNQIYLLMFRIHIPVDLCNSKLRTYSGHFIVCISKSIKTKANGLIYKLYTEAHMTIFRKPPNYSQSTPELLLPYWLYSSQLYDYIASIWIIVLLLNVSFSIASSALIFIQNLH